MGVWGVVLVVCACVDVGGVVLCRCVCVCVCDLLIFFYVKANQSLSNYIHALCPCVLPYTGRFETNSDVAR